MKVEKLFLDANVLFSAAYREGSGLSKFWHLERVKLISSLYVIEEATRNLPLPKQKIRLEELLNKVEIFPYVYKKHHFPEDIVLKEKDRPVLMAAVESHAHYLITGDFKDFGPFYEKEILGVKILPPSSYLRKVS